MALPAPPPLGAAMLPADALAGRVAMVTGGGSGLGLAISVELARAGAAVGVVSRDPERRRRGIEAVRALGGRAAECELDVRFPETYPAVFGAIEAELGGVDILVNNAAANFYAPAESVTPKGYATLVERIMTPAFFMSTELARRLLSRKRDGAIVNIVSGLGLTGGPGVAANAAAKAGVINLTKSLAVEWARDGVRVNAAAPGLFPHGDDDPKTREGRHAFRDGVDVTTTPGRVGAPHEFAWLVAYLCSPFAAYLTGQTISMDGGQSLPGRIEGAPYMPIREQIAAMTRPPPRTEGG